jgi:UDP-glucose 4-epimerase
MGASQSESRSRWITALFHTSENELGDTKMPSILVTGAAGFIGSHLCDALIQRGHNVIALDNLSMGRLDNLSQCHEHPSFIFHQADVIDKDQVNSIGAEAEIVVHLAAYKIPRYGNAIDTLRINALGIFNVLDLASRTGAKVVAASTSDVYGKNPTLPFDEDSDLLLGPSTIPRWSYAVSKLFDEHIALAYQDTYGFPVSLARFFGSYGPRHHLSWWGGPQSVFISAILRGEPVEIHGDGLQTRSFCYVSDTVDGLVKMIEDPKADGEIFNIGSVDEINIRDLASLVINICNMEDEVDLQYVPYETFGKYEDVRRRVPNIEKARRLLGFEPRVTLEDGLRKTIEWQKTQI